MALSFEGLPGEDVSYFLRDVYREAMADDHEDDDRWLLDHIEAALAGEALRKWVVFVDDPKSTFKKARQTLMDLFYPPKPKSSDPNSQNGLNPQNGSGLDEVDETQL